MYSLSALRRAGIVIFALASAAHIAGASPNYDGKVRLGKNGAFEAYMRPPYASNHASTLEVLPDGTLAAAWFSGAHEEADGCAIVYASLAPGSDQWSSAATVSKRKGFSNQNPVLYYDAEGKLLHLFHSQAAANSGEGGAAIWHLESSDGGASWSDPTPWYTAPGAFPRNRVVPLESGGVLFPIYNASKDNKNFGGSNYAIMAFSRGEKLSSSKGWTFAPVAGSANLVQPSVVPTGGGKNLTVFFRDRKHTSIYAATSPAAAGESSWTKPEPTTLPNNNAGIEAYALKSGRIALAFNPQTDGRDPLAIALSEDSGVTWPYRRDLQHGDSTVNGNEFSYPTVLQTAADGVIHVMFTYNRETIKYMAFNESWVMKNGSRL